MRVLLVSPFFPYPPSSGGRIRIFQLMRGLARHHEVTVLTGFNHDEERGLVAELATHCASVVAVPIIETPRSVGMHAAGLLSRTPYYRTVNTSAAFRAEFQAILARQRVDVVQIEMLHAAHLAVGLRGPMTVLDMHNVESVNARRLVHHLRPSVGQVLMLTDALKLPRYERRIVTAYTHCLAVSDVDAAELRRLAPRARISVIPNGVDPDEFAPSDAAPEPDRLAFTASFTYAPNVDAMTFFCREILPRIRTAVPTVQLSIVGQHPGPEVQALGRLPGVEVTGRVPDVRPYLARAAVVVVPLRMGSGTRLKILEAMAMEKPVVSTPLGAEGLAVHAGHDIELAQDPETFAARTVALLRDPARRARLGAEARSTVLARYAWSSIVDRLDTLYRAAAPECLV
jgi:sugar transferase (PEP-CTERM/EpsH1 system associated)